MGRRMQFRIGETVNGSKTAQGHSRRDRPRHHGGAFAKNLVKAGWHVVGYDTNAARRREAERAGAEIAQNAVELAAAVPTILTSLPKPEALADTVRKIAGAEL